MRKKIILSENVVADIKHNGRFYEVKKEPIDIDVCERCGRDCLTYNQKKELIRQDKFDIRIYPYKACNNGSLMNGYSSESWSDKTICTHCFRRLDLFFKHPLHVDEYLDMLQLTEQTLNKKEQGEN